MVLQDDKPQFDCPEARGGLRRPSAPYQEVIALASDHASACGAYDEAVKRRPGKLITLRQKARVIKKTR